MKPTNPQSNGHSHLQKWGLFVLLAGSLGFNLSMNPEHFNNIARNEGGTGFFDLASNQKSWEQLMKERNDKLEAEFKKLKVSDEVIEKIFAGMGEYNQSKLPTGTGDIQHAMIKAGIKPDQAEKYFKQIPSAISAMPKKDAKVADDGKASAKQAHDKKSEDKVQKDKAAAAAPKKADAADKKSADATKTEPTAATADANQAEGQQGADAAGENKTKGKGPTLLTESQLKNMIKGVVASDMEDRIQAAVKDAFLKQQKNEAITQQGLLPEGNKAPAQPGTQPTAANPAPAAGQEAQTPKSASTSPTTPPASATAPNENLPKGFQYDLSATEGYCTYSVELENGKTTVTAKKAVSDSAAKACHLDGQKKSLTSNIDRIADVKTEVLAWAEGKSKSKGKDGEDDDKKEKTQKELAKEFWEKESKRCKGKKMDADERLECYQEALTKLSNDVLDDSSQAKALVLQYFKSSVGPILRTQMTMPTTEFDANGNPVVNYSHLEAADETAKTLLSELSGSNSQAVVATLSQMKASSWNIQTGYARDMYLQAQQEKESSDPMTKMMGLKREATAIRALNPGYLRMQMMRDRNEWGASLASDSFEGQMLLNRNFSQPTAAMISKLPTIEDYNKIIGGTNKQTSASALLGQMAFAADASGMGMNALDSYSTAWTSGLSSLTGPLPATLTASRIGYNRGRNLPAVGPIAAGQQQPGIPGVQAKQTGVPAIPTSTRNKTTNPRLGILTEPNSF